MPSHEPPPADGTPQLPESQLPESQVPKSQLPGQQRAQRRGRRDPFPGLPVDPDLGTVDLRDAAGVRHRDTPPHADPRLIGLVLLGGAIGAPVRYLIARSWVTAPHGFPWSTFTINVSGAFALGLLLEFLARSGPDSGRRRGLRLLVGTGMLGAFTTYSTFALEADLLIRAHADAVAAAYAVGSVAAGLLSSLVGILVAAGGHRVLATAEPAGNRR